MSDEEEKLLEYFMDVDGISRESFLIFIDPYELPGMLKCLCLIVRQFCACC